MIRKWFKTKKMELELKHTVYSYATTLLTEKEDILQLIGRVYYSLKDVPADELKDSLIKEIAFLAHDAAQKEREAENNK